MLKFQEILGFATILVFACSLGASLIEAWPVLASHFTSMMVVIGVQVVLLLVLILLLYLQVRKGQPIGRVQILFLAMFVLMTSSEALFAVVKIAR